jgi:hypothetical protein
LQIGAGSRVDASAGDESGFHGFEKTSLPMRPVLLVFYDSEGAGDPDAHVGDVGLLAFGVFFEQYLGGDILFGEFLEEGFLHRLLLVGCCAALLVAF